MRDGPPLVLGALQGPWGRCHTCGWVRPSHKCNVVTVFSRINEVAVLWHSSWHPSAGSLSKPQGQVVEGCRRWHWVLDEALPSPWVFEKCVYHLPFFKWRCKHQLSMTLLFPLRKGQKDHRQALSPPIASQSLQRVKRCWGPTVVTRACAHLQVGRGHAQMKGPFWLQTACPLLPGACGYICDAVQTPSGSTA